MCITRQDSDTPRIFFLYENLNIIYKYYSIYKQSLYLRSYSSFMHSFIINT